MGINFDTTAATPILKQRYTRKKIETLAFKSALLSLMPKAPQEGGGSLYFGAIRSATASSVSHTANTAFTTGASSVYNNWQCAWKYGYASANVTGAAIDQTKGDMNALVDAMVSEFDGAFINLGEMLGNDLFGNGGGSYGQISASSNVGTATITLAVPSTIVNFQQGQILQVSSDDGTGGAGVRSGTVTVSAVDINLGTITCTGNWTAGIAAAAAGDYIFQQGNYNGAFPGLGGWIPAFNAGSRGNLSTSFNNVVRSADPTRLAGVAYQGNGADKDESLIQLAMLVQRMNGRPNIFVCNPFDYADLERALGSRVQYITVESFENAQVGFPAISLATPYGMIKIINDVFCPQGYGWLLNTEEWLIPSMGGGPGEGLVRVAGEGIDGLQWLRSATDDTYQMRALYRATTYCTAPGHQGVVTW